MTFEELLSSLPVSTHADWKARAQREWRGVDPESFDVLLAEGIQVAPYHTSLSDDFGLPSRSYKAWTQISDIRDAGDSIAEIALRELEGGAQGLRLRSDQLVQLQAVGEELRFDFVTLIIEGAGLDIAFQLNDLIPFEQREYANIYITTTDHQNTIQLISSKDLSSFPLLQLNFNIEGISLQDICNSAFQLFKQLASNLPNLTRLSNEIMINVGIPSNYLQAITLLGAVRYLWNFQEQENFKFEGVKLAILANVESNTEMMTGEHYLIDASVRSVAAVSAGVDALAVSAFLPEPAFRQQARNLQNVLALETNLAFAANASHGASFFAEASRVLAEATLAQSTF